MDVCGGRNLGDVKDGQTVRLHSASSSQSSTNPREDMGNSGISVTICYMCSRLTFVDDSLQSMQVFILLNILQVSDMDI